MHVELISPTRAVVDGEQYLVDLNAHREVVGLRSRHGVGDAVAVEYSEPWHSVAQAIEAALR